MSKMQEYFQGLVRAGIIPQEPNYDAMSMKIYIAYLEEENATLKEMLKKLAVTINEIDELLEVCDTNNNQHDGYCPMEENNKELGEYAKAIIDDMEVEE